jgi:hypothetical protein
VKLEFRRASSWKEPYFWNWDKGRNVRNCRIFSIEVMVHETTGRRGFSIYFLAFCVSWVW